MIADADAGYGNALNVRRTVQAFERAGVDAIQLEDQVDPKRCGHFEGKEVVPTAQMLAKLEAALEARRDPDLVIIARTDARAVEGLDAAIERACAYQRAGADAASSSRLPASGWTSVKPSASAPRCSVGPLGGQHGRGRQAPPPSAA